MATNSGPRMRRILDSFQVESADERDGADVLAELSEQVRKSPDNPSAYKRLLGALVSASQMQPGASCRGKGPDTSVFGLRLAEVQIEALERFPEDAELEYFRALRMLAEDQLDEGLARLDELRASPDLPPGTQWEIPHFLAVRALAAGDKARTAELLRESVEASFVEISHFNCHSAAEMRIERLAYDLETLALAAEIEAGRAPGLEAGSLIRHGESIILLRRFHGVALISAHAADWTLEWGIAIQLVGEDFVRPDCLASGSGSLYLTDGAGERLFVIEDNAMDDASGPLLRLVGEELEEIQSLSLNADGEIFFWGSDEGLAILGPDGEETEYTGILNNLWPITDDMPDWQREDLCDVAIDPDGGIWLYDQATLSRYDEELEEELSVDVQELEVKAKTFEDLSAFPIEPPGRRMALLKDAGVALIEKFDGFVSIYDRNGERVREIDLEEKFPEGFAPIAIFETDDGLVLLANPGSDSLLGLYLTD